MVVVAYGLLLPQVILDTPKLGCINVHGSLLPRWRGAAPIQRALWAGDTETGVTIMQMDIGLDTGAMLYKTQCPITAEDTSATLYEKLAQQGPTALVHVLDNFAECKPMPQIEEQANYAKKLSKEEQKTLENLQKSENFQPNPDGKEKGFFQRVKDMFSE